ncbi:MAG TPA: polysaccharide pyruvyl transferase family protein [Methanomassiliicoccales archaeon]|nr:polysaccharide pyruvyl transferase family protein [Methanomassiliicoccales archaeon]
MRTEASSASHHHPPKVLLVGYNGANNTGSEARLLSIIEDVRRVFGPEAVISVPTLNERNLRRYITESDTLRIEPIPSIFIFSMKRLIRNSDLVMLVEGSCYMDTWASSLLYAFNLTSRYSRQLGKPSIAYAVDSGKLAPKRIARVKRDASALDLLITRTRSSADRLKKWGVTAPIAVTDDTAFTFDAGAEEGTLKRIWPDVKGGVAGISVVDFSLWPVVLRPFGRRENCYRWPYYFSTSKERCQRSEDFAVHYAGEADRIVERYNKSVALIAMEAVDEKMAKHVVAHMHHRDRAKVFSSNEHDAATMTRVLRSLDLLITSRYHASVLSMAAGVPQMAVGHDLRLHDLYVESGLHDEFFIECESKNLWNDLPRVVDRLASEHDSIQQRILAINARHTEMAKKNAELLREFAKSKGLPVVG